MAGPYDYTVNIPQPPAQNFLQSLMGIQQLKQMEEQSAISQQQAAIQQQNAAFQQQMQPLQLEAERARIGQIGQSTATSAEALRQGRLTFEQAQAERSLKTKYQNDVLELSKNPEAWTPEKLKSLSMQASVLDPQSFSAMNRMFAELPRVGSTLSNAASEVMLSVQAGKPEIASASLDKYISAANTALESNPNDKSAQASLAFLQSAKTTLDQDPAAGALSASNFLFNTDPQKWDAVSKAMKGAGELAETEAKIKGESSKSELQQAQKRLAEADAVLKELKSTGALDSEEKMKQENAMRENFQAQPLVRNFLIRQDNYDIIKTADKSPEGDRARITAFIKLHDPNSVVSVTESGQITSTTPVAQYQSWIAKFNNDGILGEPTRDSINSQADKTIKSAESQFNAFKNNTAAIAKRYGINPKNVVEVFDRPQTQTAAPTGPASAPGLPISTGNIPVAPAGGTIDLGGGNTATFKLKK